MSEAKDRAAIKHPIATRDLWIREPNGTDRLVKVLIAAPEPEPGTNDFICKWQALGVGDGEVRISHGVDSAQALVLAIHMIAAYLEAQQNEHRLWWLDHKDPNLGFPSILKS
jgi:hypothetical protein